MGVDFNFSGFVMLPWSVYLAGCWWIHVFECFCENFLSVFLVSFGFLAVWPCFAYSSQVIYDFIIRQLYYYGTVSWLLMKNTVEPASNLSVRLKYEESLHRKTELFTGNPPEYSSQLSLLMQ